MSRGRPRPRSSDDPATPETQRGTRLREGGLSVDPAEPLRGHRAGDRLATVDLREASWLATIVGVPINGWYAGAAALPVMNPILAVGLSLPVVGLPTATIAIYVAVRLTIRWAPPGGPARFLAPFVERYRPDERGAIEAASPPLRLAPEEPSRALE